MKQVMIVDDSATMLASMRDILTRGGYAVTEADGGKPALTKLQGGYKPDLIITDLNMPDMDGIQLIKAARGLPSCRFTPILMLTTESGAGKREAAKQVGATGWLVKPVQADELMGVLKQVLPA